MAFNLYCRSCGVRLKDSEIEDSHCLSCINRHGTPEERAVDRVFELHAENEILHTQNKKLSDKLIQFDIACKRIQDCRDFLMQTTSGREEVVDGALYELGMGKNGLRDWTEEGN